MLLGGLNNTSLACFKVWQSDIFFTIRYFLFKVHFNYVRQQKHARSLSSSIIARCTWISFGHYCVIITIITHYSSPAAAASAKTCEFRPIRIGARGNSPPFHTSLQAQSRPRPFHPLHLTFAFSLKIPPFLRGESAGNWERAHAPQTSKSESARARVAAFSMSFRDQCCLDLV